MCHVKKYLYNNIILYSTIPAILVLSIFNWFRVQFHDFSLINRYNSHGNNSYLNMRNFERSKNDLMQNRDPKTLQCCVT